MSWTNIVFKLACPESDFCEPTQDGLQLVAEFNQRLLPFESDQHAVRAAFAEIDQEQIDKYGLKINVHVDVNKYSWRPFFKIACPEYLEGELNAEGLALAQDLNARLERSNEEQWKVANELATVDEDLVNKYQLTVIAAIECRTW